MSVSEARRELLQKSRERIEEETAFRWADRALAAWQLYATSGADRWLRDAEEYHHEAVEHAALADETGEVLRRLREYLRENGPQGMA